MTSAAVLWGLRVIESDVVGEPYEDWSQVRSHGRAKRRRSKHKQRIVIRYKANGTYIKDECNHAIICHPHDAAKLRQAVPPHSSGVDGNPWLI